MQNLSRNGIQNNKSKAQPSMKMNCWIKIFLLLFFIRFSAKSQNTKMEYIETKLDKFYVVGISVRTTNQNALSQKDIGELWGKFYAQNYIEKIPNKVSNDVFCIYTDYESDQNGAYTTIIGCKVTAAKEVPEGMILKEIPESKYRVYTAKGKMPDCVIATWQHIWQSPITRKYTADFDIYGEKAQNPNDAEVETYLSVE
jgi:predicted transcriptional regulator YdeE